MFFCIKNLLKVFGSIKAIVSALSSILCFMNSLAKALLEPKGGFPINSL